MIPTALHTHVMVSISATRSRRRAVKPPPNSAGLPLASVCDWATDEGIDGNEASMTARLERQSGGEGNEAWKIPCLGGNAYVNVANVTTKKGWDEYSCDEKVVTSVFLALMPNFPTDFGTLLRGGFELEWGTMYECDRSDGQCGHHNTNGLLCFCPGGTNNHQQPPLQRYVTVLSLQLFK
ncbi:hypothetical protein E3N88_04655 [Mikania micrantha]|uniref:Wall-associated receptor kinase C-terminal domain-containing protein n=1 Tax=Mikania micrantha TaxID=192012 RepID=A0A5N6PWG4_9ASTR|nr:hypothetical protein E3N88_04655 [Mikania micrantha]